jgi:hypothetical protein
MFWKYQILGGSPMIVLTLVMLVSLLAAIFYAVKAIVARFRKKELVIRYTLLFFMCLIIFLVVTAILQMNQS